MDEMPRVPSDVIKATLHFLGEQYRFAADMPKISAAFNDISRREKFKKFFNDYIFDESQSYPECEIIEFAFSRLQSTGLLACMNPDLREFEITKVLSSSSSLVLNKFDQDEKELLEEMALEFKKLMN